jgi:hypothetical protein
MFKCKSCSKSFQWAERNADFGTCQSCTTKTNTLAAEKECVIALAGYAKWASFQKLRTLCPNHSFEQIVEML